MSTQTRTGQRERLELFRSRGYRGLYWYVEVTWNAGKQISPVGYPGEWLPLVPVAPDPEASRRIAGMLAYLLRLAVDTPGRSFEVVLTDEESLRVYGAKWYVWTEDVPLDAVCAYCGAVEVAGHTLVEVDGDNMTWLCAVCAERSTTNE